MKPNVIPQLTGGLDVSLLSIRKAQIAVWRLPLDDPSLLIGAKGLDVFHYGSFAESRMCASGVTRNTHQPLAPH